MRHLIIAVFVLMLSSQNVFSQDISSQDISSQKISSQKIWAQEDRGLITTMPAMEAPWSAVGQLDKPGNRYCTGTLVGTRLVITAAHCLWNKKKRDWYPNDSIVFRAGFSHGAEIASANITATHIHPQFDPELKNSGPLRIRDWAFLVLDKDIGLDAGFMALAPIPDGEITAGTRLVEVGYAEHMSRIQQVHLGCLIHKVSKGLFYHYCNVGKGDSGSPLILWRDGSFFVVAFHASSIYSKKLGKAVPSTTFLDKAYSLGASPQSFKGLAASAPTQSVRVLLPLVGFGPDSLKSYQRARGMEPTGIATLQVVGKIITELR